MRQLAMPVTSSRIAPRAMAITEVSPMLPGMPPHSIVQASGSSVPPLARMPRGVAPVKASGWSAIQTLSPDMTEG